MVPPELWWHPRRAEQAGPCERPRRDEQCERRNVSERNVIGACKRTPELDHDRAPCSRGRAEAAAGQGRMNGIGPVPQPDQRCKWPGRSQSGQREARCRAVLEELSTDPEDLFPRLKRARGGSLLL